MERRKGGRKKAAGKRKATKSAFQKFVEKLESMAGTDMGKASNGMRQLMFTYQTTLPQRMPSVRGPTKGAMFTYTQYVPQSSMGAVTNGGAVVGDLIRQSTNAPVFAGYAFTAADLANIASLGALFDQYRIDAVQLRFRSKNNAVSVYNTASPNNAAVGPLIVIDRDDNTAPTTLSELHQYDNCIDLASQDSCDILIEPSITPSVFAGGAFSGYAVDDSGKYWLDKANTTIPHYGVKIGIPALPTSTTNRFDWLVEAWYKVSFRNVR